MRGGASPYLKTSYAEDTALAGTGFRKAWLGILFLGLVILPLAGTPLLLALAARSAIAIVGALALNLLTGSTGLVSLGHAGLIAAGAFTSGVLAGELGAPFWVVLPAALGVGAVLGLLVGAPSLRLRGLYLALSTLALHFVILYVLSEYQSARGFTTGLMVPPPSLGPLVLRGAVAWYYALTAVAVLATVFCLNLVRSRSGRAWMAIRDRDIAAAATGVNVAAWKLRAFVVSSAITALSGSLWAYYNAFVSVEAFSFFMTVEYIAMIIIGGMGSVLGSVLGALTVTVLPYAIDAVVNALPASERIQPRLFAVKSGAFGLLMALFLTLEPRGLAYVWSRVRSYLELWPFRHHPLRG